MDISSVPKKIHRHTLRAMNFLSSGIDDRIPEADIIEHVKYLTRNLNPVTNVDQAIKTSLRGFYFLGVLDFKDGCYSRLYELDTYTIARRLDDIMSLSESSSESDTESEESSDQLDTSQDMEDSQIPDSAECACLPDSDGNDNSQAENSSESQEYIYEECPRCSTQNEDSSGSEFAFFEDL